MTDSSLFLKHELIGAPDELSLRTQDLGTTYQEAWRFGQTIGITRVGLISGLDILGLPVATAYRPNSRSLSVSQGKGTSSLGSKVSALMESIEIFQAETFSGPLEVGSRRELLSRWKVCEIEDLPKSPGAELLENDRILWTPSQHHQTGQDTLVPYDLVHANYVRSPAGTVSAFNLSTNGLASGNNLTEAKIHSLCELIERDAATMWWLSTESTRESKKLDLRNLGEPFLQSLVDWFVECGLSIAIWDMITDVDVPAYICLVTDKDGPTGLSSAGMGCHPSPITALLRAILEAAQSRATIIAGAREDLHPHAYDIARLRGHIVNDRELLRLNGTVNFMDRAGQEVLFSNLNQTLDHLVSKVSKIGLRDIFFVDISPDEADLSVVRTIVPGLESLGWEGGYSPGRRAKFAMKGRVENA